jgi:hypothetical protein
MRFVLSFIFLITSSLSFAAHKIPAFTGPDFTGVYQCNGLDMHEGEYKGKVTLKLKKEHSQAQYGSYDFYSRYLVMVNTQAIWQQMA